MAKFNWEARSKTGATQKGVMEAGTAIAVEVQLKKYGFTGINIKEAGKGLSFEFNFFAGEKD